MHETFMTMPAREYADEVAVNKAGLKAHCEATRRREKLAREAGIAKLSEAYIDAFYYFKKWVVHRRAGKRRRRLTQCWEI
eukprot:4835483-Pleurochrysis_carterae.AAC.3